MRTAIALAVLCCTVTTCTNGLLRDRGSTRSSTVQPAVSSPPPCSDQASVKRFTLGMRDYRFRPDCLTVSEITPFHLRNRTTTTHNLTIAGTGLSIDVPPGHTRAESPLHVLGVKPGTYRFYCRFHRGRGMTGVIH